MLPRRSCHGAVLNVGFSNLENVYNAVAEIFDMVVIQCKNKVRKYTLGLYILLAT